jgi:glutamate racemase
MLTYATTETIHVATFDSGFGGFFTTKAIEQEAKLLAKKYPVTFKLTHLGDSANAPYGQKSPEEIAELSSKNIMTLWDMGASEIYLACNTASSQFEAIKKILDKKNPAISSHVHSIIETSVEELEKRIHAELKNPGQELHVLLLSTPATLKSQVYIKALAKVFQLPYVESSITKHNQPRWFSEKGATVESVESLHELVLPNKQKIYVHQLGPANWVEMIEHGAPMDVIKKQIAQDLKLINPMPKNLTIMGEFCTHFPVLDKEINEALRDLKLSSENLSVIKQGPLMANMFKNLMEEKFQGTKVKAEKNKTIKISPEFLMTGTNKEETQKLILQLFPNDPLPEIKVIK